MFRNLTILKEKLVRVINFIPVIWKTNCWDYSSIYELLSKQLELMEPVIRKGSGLHSEKYAKQIRVCKNLIDRMIDDNYDLEAHRENEDRLGAFHSESRPLPNGFSELVMWYGDKEDREKNSIRHRKISKLIYKKWQNKRKEDREYLFSMLFKHMHNWWD